MSENVQNQENGIRVNFPFGGRKKSYLRAVPTVALCVIAYLLLGFLLEAWHPAWIIFMAIPLWQTVVYAIEHRRPNAAIVATVTLTIYLSLVFVWPKSYDKTWLVILIIPAYYSVMSSIKEIKRRRIKR